MKRASGLAVSLTVATLTTSALAQPKAPTVTVLPDHVDAVYDVGETVKWTVTWRGSEPPPAGARYTLKSGGLKEVGSGALTFTGNVATFESKFTEPNTVLAVVTWGPAPTARATGGAVAAPLDIAPAAPEPADFDAFWKAKLAELKQIPPNPQLTEGPSLKPGVTYAKVTLDNINNTKVQGQIARPEKGEKFPAILITQWAGVYGLQKQWVTDKAADGWLALNIEPHDIPIDKLPAYYAELYGPNGALHNYWKIGNEDRETSYYLRMYLGVCQAVEYLKSRPDWDGKTIVVMGASQGGQQALAVAGLMPNDITACLPFLPAACDNWGPSIGRAAGFPNWWAQVDNRDAGKVRETSKYFDPVYFASRIGCPVLTGLGLRDDLAPPSSVLAAANAITAPKEVLILPLAGHQDEGGSQGAYNERLYRVWLPALKKGELPPVAR